MILKDNVKEITEALDVFIIASFEYKIITTIKRH